MATGCEESTNGPSPSPPSNGNNDSGDFECNICFELPQDPIVTLCGHLFCWPCLYKWLHHHSQSQECPVCKALIQEEKLVPLYGRGKTTSDPRSRPVPGADIPNRPSGQRPATAPPPAEQNYFSNIGFGLLGGFIPMATARFGNMTMSAGFGGLFPSILNFQPGFPEAAVYGAAHGYPYGYAHAFHGGHGLGAQNHGYQRAPGQGQDSILKTLLLLIGVFVLLTLMWS
ncbi:hypothetical protein Nepgr_008303 [Nepenthes gracilis]|uniref:E3 ubiquitin-protein ligase RMA n=1 Tax=Nepenthes gracilis TaxID=150966 RepID=A0AAD3XJ48_NEPGR|nr:hypothetical protein Nepgr_008303 [Nepenthes gracilis]